MDPLLFKFQSRLRVRNYEVDWQGIVHNANYLLYFETGRIEYLKNAGIRVDMDSVQNGFRIVLVRNEIDYRSPAGFDELLSIHSRIADIRKTSFIFEGFITEAGSGRLLAENVAYHVWLDAQTGQPAPISDQFRRQIGDFEGSTTKIAKPPFDT
jgi:acyl-CoA thioester hydrolase